MEESLLRQNHISLLVCLLQNSPFTPVGTATQTPSAFLGRASPLSTPEHLCTCCCFPESSSSSSSFPATEDTLGNSQARFRFAHFQAFPVLTLTQRRRSTAVSFLGLSPCTGEKDPRAQRPSLSLTTVPLSPLQSRRRAPSVSCMNKRESKLRN